MSSQAFIEVRHLRKQFKTPVVKQGRFAGLRTLFSRDYTVKDAVRDISFSINKGEFVGYIGPNGAGKSTTIKMLTGILHPTSGEVYIGGDNPHRHRRQVVRRLGVVFGQRSQLWWDLPVKDSYDILAAIYQVDPKQQRMRLEPLIKLLGLDEFWSTPVRKLSLGQRMRADLAAALLHDPELLFLDEPTIGLDITVKREIRRFLRTINQQFGKTILLTTHDMDDIEQMCDRVMVINNGNLAYNGTIEKLRRMIGLPTRIRITFRGTYRIPGEASRGELRFRVIEGHDNSLVVEVNRQERKAIDILREISAWGDIDDIDMEEPAFEEVIHRVY